MKDLTVCPSILQEGYDTYSPIARRTLFDGHAVSHIFSEASPDTGTVEANEAVKSVGRISLSGAQPKFSIVVDDDKLRYIREGEQGTFILKPRPTAYQIINKDFCVANEHVTMQIASQVYGIETAANALCFFDDGTPAYITRRFDVHSKGKYKQEDFAALLGYTKDNAGSNYKYDKASYEECAEVIHRYVKATLIDIRRFFRIILFNFVTLNDDAHLKNFSLIERNGEYRLSPAYDLINTSLQLMNPHIFALDKGLFKEGMAFSDTHTISRSDFEEFGKRIGLPIKVIKQEIDMFAAEQPLVKELLSRSFLSPSLQKQYWMAFDYRRKMLNF
ncbi:MAG: HipA domain-containing protein [Alphaproteobacteria bacterium]|nr:HipA domain-containing protein [Bacteroidales bacterium]MBQ2883301.1 HipA domain-containing protein [Alphaproteobacteria bacterium]